MDWSSDLDEDAFERKLYVVPKCADHEDRQSGIEGTEMSYTPSLWRRTIVYKVLRLAPEITKWRVSDRSGSRVVAEFYHDEDLFICMNKYFLS